MSTPVQQVLAVADDAFQTRDYEKALKICTSGLETCGENVELRVLRTNCLLKLQKYKDALREALLVVEVEPTHPKGYYNCGLAYFYAGQYVKGKECFGKALKLMSKSPETTPPNTILTDDKSIKMWIHFCEDKLKRVSTTETSVDDEHTENGDVSGSEAEKDKTDESEKTPKADEKTPEAGEKKTLEAGEGAGKPDESSAAPVTVKAPVVKRDFYQTDSDVVATFLIKNFKKDSIKANYQKRSLEISGEYNDGQSFKEFIELFAEIVPEKCSMKVMSVKIEVKLQKSEMLRWTKLEALVPELDEAAKKEVPPLYPSSVCPNRDWSAVEKHIAETYKDELEGDAALNDLFSKIYGDGSDEVKRAMNKSYSESGGTVLSTNWDDVGRKKTEIKPPDGMEWKKWSS